VNACSIGKLLQFMFPKAVLVCSSASLIVFTPLFSSYHSLLQVRTVKMLAQAVCSMAVCKNVAAGVNCMWASSYDGELSSWVIDELCVPTEHCSVGFSSNCRRLEDRTTGSSLRKAASGSQSGDALEPARSASAVSEEEPEDPACTVQ